MVLFRQLGAIHPHCSNLPEQKCPEAYYENLDVALEPSCCVTLPYKWRGGGDIPSFETYSLNYGSHECQLTRLCYLSTLLWCILSLSTQKWNKNHRPVPVVVCRNNRKQILTTQHWWAKQKNYLVAVCWFFWSLFQSSLSCLLQIPLFKIRDFLSLKMRLPMPFIPAAVPKRSFVYHLWMYNKLNVFVKYKPLERCRYFLSACIAYALAMENLASKHRISQLMGFFWCVQNDGTFHSHGLQHNQFHFNDYHLTYDPTCHSIVGHVSRGRYTATSAITLWQCASETKTTIATNAHALAVIV